jgi:AI-2E family transporter
MAILGSLLAQGILAGVGFLVAGVPGALLLGFLTFFLSIVPGGPALLWLPASLWRSKPGATGGAICLALWGWLVVGTADHVLTPSRIGRGSNLPFIFVLLGVLGIFLGPTLLAVGDSVVRDWSLVTPDLIFVPGLGLPGGCAVLGLRQGSGDGASHGLQGVPRRTVALLLARGVSGAPGKAPQ